MIENIYFQVSRVFWRKTLDGCSPGVVKSSPLDKSCLAQPDWWGLVQWQDN
jgi:hypothetical protein